jgi:hypothetical protein
MATNPWLVFGLGLAGSIGTMLGTLYTSPDKYEPSPSVTVAAMTNGVSATSRNTRFGAGSTSCRPPFSPRYCLFNLRSWLELVYTPSAGWLRSRGSLRSCSFGCACQCSKNFDVD